MKTYKGQEPVNSSDWKDTDNFSSRSCSTQLERYYNNLWKVIGSYTCTMSISSLLTDIRLGALSSLVVVLPFCTWSDIIFSRLWEGRLFSFAWNLFTPVKAENIAKLTNSQLLSKFLSFFLCIAKSYLWCVPKGTEVTNTIGYQRRNYGKSGSFHKSHRSIRIQSVGMDFQIIFNWLSEYSLFEQDKNGRGFVMHSTL